MKILQRDVDEIRANIQYLNNQSEAMQQQLFIIQQHLLLMQEQSLGTQ